VCVFGAGEKPLKMLLGVGILPGKKEVLLTSRFLMYGCKRKLAHL